MKICTLIERQKKFSKNAFGPGKCLDRIVDHIKEELSEVETSEGDLVEWVDVILLAIDGAWRAGYNSGEIEEMLFRKLKINEQREWPDPKSCDSNRAINHIEKSADILDFHVPQQNIGATHWFIQPNGWFTYYKLEKSRLHLWIASTKQWVIPTSAPSPLYCFADYTELCKLCGALNHGNITCPECRCSMPGWNKEKENAYKHTLITPPYGTSLKSPYMALINSRNLEIIELISKNG